MIFFINIKIISKLLYFIELITYNIMCFIIVTYSCQGMDPCGIKYLAGPVELISLKNYIAYILSCSTSKI